MDSVSDEGDSARRDNWVGKFLWPGVRSIVSLAAWILLGYLMLVGFFGVVAGVLLRGGGTGLSWWDSLIVSGLGLSCMAFGAGLWRARIRRLDGGRSSRGDAS